ncbi:FHA domain-containing protein [Candidatus Poribacteria bacterium]
MKCPECEFDNLAGTAYCDGCGTELSSEDTSSQPDTPADTETVQPSETAKLILTTTGSEYPISKDIVLLGRESVADSVFPEIDLAPDDPEGYVSRRHAQIQRQGEGYIVMDLDSMNGTFVNNKVLLKNEHYPLTNDDEIRMGKTVLKFMQSSAG